MSIICLTLILDLSHMEIERWVFTVDVKKKY